MTAQAIITPDLIRKLISFDDVSGKYFWQSRPESLFSNWLNAKRWNARFAGKEIFICLNGSGYKTVMIFNRSFQAHRVIWAYHHGEWPTADIDHMNGDKADNRLSNLRVVTRELNNKNRPRRTDNTSGYNGVYWNRQSNKWQALIQAEGKQKHLGYFSNIADAVLARKKAEPTYGYHANHGRVSNEINPESEPVAP